MKNWTVFALLVLLMIISAFTSTTAQRLGVYFNSGAMLSGTQDQKFKLFNEGTLQTTVYPERIVIEPTKVFFAGVHYELKRIKLGFAFSIWEPSSTAIFKPDNKIEVPSLNIEQARETYFISVETKLLTKVNWNVDLMLGIGMVQSDIDSGSSGKKQGCSVGVANHMAIMKNMSLSLQASYFLTYDVDNYKADGWVVDVSGAPKPFRFGPHWDTKFYAITIGLNYDF